MGSSGKDDLRQLLKKNAEMLGVPLSPKINDILVHCCVEDVKWVKEHLLVQLENMLKRRCYLSYRDGKELGKDATDAINDDINSAANLLLVISQKYLAYSWHAYYIKMAHRKSIMEDIPLAIIFLDDVKGLKFPEFGQVQGCLVHHILLQWEKGATKKQQQQFWQELSNKHLNNKNVERPEEREPKITTDRDSIVSVSFSEKVGFIHSQRDVEVYKAPDPVRKQHSNVDSQILESQIIVDEQDVEMDGVKSEEHEKELSTQVDVGRCESNMQFFYDAQLSVAGKNEQTASGSQMTNVNSREAGDNYHDTICRSSDKSRNTNRNNRCGELHESQFSIEDALLRGVFSGLSVLSGSASGREHTCRNSRVNDGTTEVPVHEEIIEKVHLVQEKKDDIAILLEHMEKSATEA